MADKQKLILCPYCGNTQTEPEDRCQACGGFFDSLSLRVTQQAMGPWFIRDRHMPFRPGCSYEVLRKQIEKGKIKPTTIIRGPTTRQFWSVARNVPGVAHLLGYCHACGHHVEQTDDGCPHCGEVFFLPKLRDQLGLAPQDPALHAAAVRAQRQEADAGKPTGVSLKDTVISNDVHDAAGSGILANLRLPQPLDDLTLQDSGPLPAAQPADPPVRLPAQQTDDAATGPPDTGGRHDAMRWMTASGDDEPDNLETAGNAFSAGRIDQTGRNWTTWLLVGMNILLVIAVIAVIVYIVTRPPQTNPELPKPQAPVNPASSSASATAPGVPADPVTPAQNQVASATVPPSAAQPQPAPPTPVAIGLPVDNPWARMFEQAARARQLGDYAQAVALLEKIDRNVPPSLRPIDLDKTLADVKQKLHEENIKRFLLASVPPPASTPAIGPEQSAPVAQPQSPRPAVSQPGSSPTAHSNIFSATAPLTEAERQKQIWSHRYAEALALEFDGEYAKSMIILEEIAKAPAEQRPQGFAETYQRIKKKLKKP